MMINNLVSSTWEASDIIMYAALELDKKRQGKPYKINYKDFNRFLKTMDKTAEGLKEGFNRSEEVSYEIEEALSKAVVKVFDLTSSKRADFRDISAGLELLSEELGKYTMLKESELKQVFNHLGLIHYCMLYAKDNNYRRFAA